MDPFEIPIDGILDLHTFSPKEVEDVLESYLAECVEREIYSVRIIHGKGRGVLRRRVYGLLSRNPLVVSLLSAPPEAGGWGATLVELKPKP